MKTNNSLNLLESKLERSQRIREEEVEEEKEKNGPWLEFKVDQLINSFELFLFNVNTILMLNVFRPFRVNKAA